MNVGDADAVRLDVVLGRLLEVEQHAFERARLRRRRRAARARTRRSASVRIITLTSLDVKPTSFALDRLIGAARHLGVARA